MIPAADCASKMAVLCLFAEALTHDLIWQQHTTGLHIMHAEK